MRSTSEGRGWWSTQNQLLPLPTELTGFPSLACRTRPTYPESPRRPADDFQSSGRHSRSPTPYRTRRSATPSPMEYHASSRACFCPLPLDTPSGRAPLPIPCPLPFGATIAVHTDGPLSACPAPPPSGTLLPASPMTPARHPAHLNCPTHIRLADRSTSHERQRWRCGGELPGQNSKFVLCGFRHLPPRQGLPLALL
jgi:hypothetical protein